MHKNEPRVTVPTKIIQQNPELSEYAEGLYVCMSRECMSTLVSYKKPIFPLTMGI